MKRVGLAVGVAALVFAALPAQAGLWQDIYRGLDLLATPSGFPLLTAGDGTRVNGQRAGRLRIVPNGPGNGYELQLDRTFGLDSQGRPEILDLGPYELQLQGDTQATLGYTNTGFLIGTGAVSANNLNYSVRQATGLQDIELRGTLNVGSFLEVNPAGFYTLDLNVSNANSELLLDGVVVQADEETNFNIGPIAIKGNIYIDALGVVLGNLGVDTTFLEQLFPGSPIDQLTNELDELFRIPGLTAGTTALYDGQLPPAPGVPVLDFPAGRAAPPPAPEPASAVLLVLGGLAICRRR